MRHRCLLLATILGVLAFLLNTLVHPQTVEAGRESANGPPVSFRDRHFIDGSGQPEFLLGINYEGPVDRAWAMWDKGRFDPGMISRDMDHASAAHLSVMRLFIQGALAANIWQSNWTTLDQVLTLADQHGLKLIITFADYPEMHLARVVQLETAVAARYHGRSTILAYDLKNEPHFSDLALTHYPPGVHAALQDYAYVNIRAAYLRFLRQAHLWAAIHHGTIVQYVRSSDSAPWTWLKNALDESFGAWLKPQLDAIRAVDPGRPLTVGQGDPIIASLSVNEWLDFRTLHCYPAATQAGVQACIALFDAVRASVPDRPLVLGEFGFANADVDEQRSAALEVALVRAVRDHGGIGALKWMLNDFPQGFNAREDSFGMFRGDGSPKPVVAAFSALADLRPIGSH